MLLLMLSNLCYVDLSVNLWCLLLVGYRWNTLNMLSVNLSPLSDEDDDVALLTVETEPGVFAIRYMVYLI